eukprot:TRINITY_DN10233_c0_g1_i1.p1 TRINITY_DN10233_c0_g1~~TRINITY_DN10233_c0_g1_i1.p1  ORF type:complete len:118 (-),score=3.66 TRINITY_DN10233_c0_g1_i1:73-426(-)
MLTRIRLREFCRAVELFICNEYNQEVIKGTDKPAAFYLDEIDPAWLDEFQHKNQLPANTKDFLRKQRRIGSEGAKLTNAAYSCEKFFNNETRLVTLMLSSFASTLVKFISTTHPFYP